MKSDQDFDSALSALFASSLPVSKPKSHLLQSPSSAQRYAQLQDIAVAGIPTISSDNDSVPVNPAKKRKRKHDREEELEDAYLRKLVEEQEKDNQRTKKLKTICVPPTEETDIRSESTSVSDKDTSVDLEDEVSIDGVHDTIPQHETLAKDYSNDELDKASRTVFLGNVSNTCIKSKASKRQLVEHLSSFLENLSKADKAHKVESIRFRSTAFSSTSLPKKAAFAKKALMDTTTQSTNAYAIYSTQKAAREAVKKLNGTVVLDRHLRVDSVAHPSKIDHRRCVFVGNLGFVDDDSNIKASQNDSENSKPIKKNVPADIEEGLWRQFGKAGIVESVRVVRDKITRVGKGIAYVQFKDGNAVEKALLFNDKKFPPLLPRTLRVTRAKSITKTASQLSKSEKNRKSERETGYVPKRSSRSQSIAGRAGKLFGKAGAATYRKEAKPDNPLTKTPEHIVFEGYRARGDQGKGSLFRKSKKHGKPTGRSSRRGAAFKASKSRKP